MDLVLFLERSADALGARGDDLPQDVFVADDLEVVGHVRRRRHEGEKAGYRRGAADSFQQVSIAQNLGEGDQVDALSGIPQLDEDEVNRLVRGNVEVVLVNFLDAFRDDFARRDQHRTQDALLRLYAVRQ